MDDERPKPSLADDPNFLASLGELDHGLSHDAMDDAVLPPRPRDKAARPAAPAPCVPAAPASAGLPGDLVADVPFEAPAMQFAARRGAAAGAAPRRRAFAAFPAAAMAPLPTPLSTPEPIAPVTAPAATGQRRPLIDLFPPASTVPAESAAPPRTRRPALGTTPPPRLPRTRAGRSAASVVPDPTLTYEPFYGLDEKPFGLSADLKFLYHSTSHDRVIQQLSDAIGRGDRVVALTGEIGAGKTTLCRALVGQLDRRTLTSLVVDPLASVDDLLKTVLADFGVLSRDDVARTASATSQDLRAALVEFLASLASLQASAVVIIDEAQNMSPDVLDELRAWTDGESGQQRLQIMLAGQPSLTPLLRRHEHRSLDHRITVRCELTPLLPDEVVGYVMHRLSVAGSSVRVEFDDDAIARLNAISRGVPRLVNLLCDRALTRGYQASASAIDAALIEDAASDLDLGAPRSGAAQLARTAVVIAVLAALMFAGAGGAAWLFRDRVQQAIATWRTPAPVTPAAAPR